MMIEHDYDDDWREMMIMTMITMMTDWRWLIAGDYDDDDDYDDYDDDDDERGDDGVGVWHDVRCWYDSVYDAGLWWWWLMMMICRADDDERWWLLMIV